MFLQRNVSSAVSSPFRKRFLAVSETASPSPFRGDVSLPSRAVSSPYPSPRRPRYGNVIHFAVSVQHREHLTDINFIGVCNLCNRGVKFVKDHVRNRSIRFEALQSETGKKLLMRSGRAPDDISSVVLVEKDRSYIKSEAVLKIMKYIDLPFPQLAFFFQFAPLFVRDFLYENVANNRYAMFGRSDSCEI